MNAYYNPERTGTSSQRVNNISPVTYGDGFINFICAIVAFFTSVAAVKVEKVCVSALCFFAFFGIVGSMEAGSINMFAGSILCGIAAILEYLVLKSLIKKK